MELRETIFPIWGSYPPIIPRVKVTCQANFLGSRGRKFKSYLLFLLGSLFGFLWHSCLLFDGKIVLKGNDLVYLHTKDMRDFF